MSKVIYAVGPLHSLYIHSQSALVFELEPPTYGTNLMITTQKVLFHSL